MPQVDRHYPRDVLIEFNYNEEFKESVIPERFRLVLITSGSATLLINDRTISVSAPMTLCLSIKDSVKLLNKRKFAAKSFMFAPKFLNKKLSFEAIDEDNFKNWHDKHDSNILQVFVNHNDNFSGELNIPASMYLTINQWFGIIGTETFAQSDKSWTCRIRRYIIQILYLLEDLYRDLVQSDFKQQDELGDNHVKIALEYIHANYNQDISLDTLCKISGLNRTSLNRRFKERTGATMINYLINHRIKIACEALITTELPLNEIAESCGFMYDSYFSKQFSKRVGVSPAEYRKNAMCCA